jgi:hypothetical protein
VGAVPDGVGNLTTVGGWRLYGDVAGSTASLFLAGRIEYVRVQGNVRTCGYRDSGFDDRFGGEEQLTFGLPPLGEAVQYLMVGVIPF